MSIFQKVTLASLRKNKMRTTVTIIGIILSAAMICAVTSLIVSVRRYMEEVTVYQNGSWHGSAEGVDWKTYERIQQSDSIKKAAYGQQLGYAELENCTNPQKPYLYLLGAGEGFDELLPLHAVEGRIPQTDSEIMLPQHLTENGGIEYKLGDTLTLALGNRMQDGFVMNQWNPCFYSDEEGEHRFDETIEVRETRTFTVVGIYERLPYKIEDTLSPGYTAFTVADADAATTAIAYDVYFQMQDPDEVYAFVEDNALEGQINSEVLLAFGTARYNSFYVMLYSLAAIVIGLIMFGSISLIYNAFSISVSERTKQFGLLASIGATKKQLRKMVLFEALAVSAIGIPIGIVVGILGIGTTLLFVGQRMGQFLGSSVVLRLHISPEAMLIACLVALVTVFISAWVPSRRATRVSAVEAIRQTMDVQAKRPVRTSRLTYRLFGLPGVLASKHYKRSKKKYRATVVSLFMSIVLFVSASAFSDYLTESVMGGLGGPQFDLAFLGDESELGGLSPDELLAQLKTAEGVTDGAYTRSRGQRCRIDRSFLTDDAPEMVDIGIYFVDDDSFRELLAEYGLSETEFMNPEAPLAVAIDRNTRFDYLQEKYVTQQILRSDVSETTLKGEGAEPKTIRSGKTIDEKPFYIEDGDEQLIYLYPMCAEKALQNAEGSYTFLFTSKDHDVSYTAMKKLMKEAGISSSWLMDIAARMESRRNVVLILQVFAYGFIVLISMIAAANVFNTISTNLALRRREFAMLKSVGMTTRGLNRMMNFECLLYGSKALLYGLPAASGVTYLIYQAVSNGYSTGFRLPWTAIGIAVCSVFAVVFVTMMYAMSKIKKENPIDALRNENL